MVVYTDIRVAVNHREKLLKDINRIQNNINRWLIPRVFCKNGVCESKELIFVLILLTNLSLNRQEQAYQLFFSCFLML